MFIKNIIEVTNVLLLNNLCVVLIGDRKHILMDWKITKNTIDQKPLCTPFNYDIIYILMLLTF